VAGIVGQACSNSRIRGSTASTTDPRGCRRYAGGPSASNAFFTVFFEHPTTRAITLIGIRSARYNRRISAQSSTLNTHFLLTSAEVSIIPEGVSFRLPLRGQFSPAVDNFVDCLAEAGCLAGGLGERDWMRPSVVRVSADPGDAADLGE
jgi:hypothetical protein